MNSLAKNSVHNTLCTLANLLFPLVTSMYVSRVLLAEGVGQVSYAQTVTSWFITFAALGLPTYGIREIAKVRGDPRETDRVFSELLVIGLGTTAVASAAFALLVFGDPAFAGQRTLYLCCGLQLILSGFNIEWFYRGREEFGFILGRSLAVKLLSLAAVVLVVKEREDIIPYALISSLAHGGNHVLSILHARKFITFRLQGLRPLRHIPAAGVFALASLCTGIYSKLDITMLGSLSDDRAVGLYTNAHYLAVAATTLCAAVSAAFLPRLSYCYTHRRDEFPALIETGIRAQCFFAIPMAAGLFLLAPELVELVYGADFAPAAVTLRLLSLLVVIQGFGNLLCYQLAIATGNEGKRLPAYAGAAVLNGMLNAGLIPFFGHNGAAAASVISELALNCHQLIVMRRVVTYSFDLRALGQALFGTGVMAGFLIWLNRLELSPMAHCLIGFAGGSFIYLMINYLLKNSLLMGVIKILRERRNTI